MVTFNKRREPTAPQCRLDILNVFTNKAKVPGVKPLKFFGRLKRVYPNLEKYSDTQIKNLIYRFNREVLLEQVACTREGVELPGNLGHIFLGTFGHMKEGNELVNVVESVKQGKRVYYTSNHTDGHSCKVYYTNTAVKLRFENADYWGFTACKHLRKRCSAEYSKQWQKYFKVTKTRFISAFVRGIPYNWKYLKLPTY